MEWIDPAVVWYDSDCNTFPVNKKIFLKMYSNTFSINFCRNM